MTTPLVTKQVASQLGKYRKLISMSVSERRILTIQAANNGYPNLTKYIEALLTHASLNPAVGHSVRR